LEKAEPEKTSALKLLACLSEETKLAIFRELNRMNEGFFTGRLGFGKVIPEDETEKLEVLMAIEKERDEQDKLKSKQFVEAAAKEIPENRMLD
jgi:16S rRNA C1402 (ribose-2'-O) methylase RsmI